MLHSKETGSNFALRPGSDDSIEVRSSNAAISTVLIWPANPVYLHAIEKRPLFLYRNDDGFERRLLGLIGGEFGRYRWQIRLQQIRLVRYQLRLLLRSIRRSRPNAIDCAIEVGALRAHLRECVAQLRGQ